MQKILTILFPALLIILNLQTPNALAETKSDSPANIEAIEKETPEENTEPSSEITLEEILDGYYQSIGGEKTWQSLKTLKFTGSMYTKEATFKTAALYKRPDLCRIDFQTGRLYFIEAYDGTIPWQMNSGTRSGASLLKGKRAKEMIDTCDFDGPLVDHKEKGHEIKYIGIEKVENRRAYLLEVQTKTGNTDKYYIDTETFLPFIVKGSTTIQDKVVNTTIHLSEYMEIGDITIPFSYEFIVDGNPSTETLKIKTIELNPEIEDDMFKLPRRPQDLR
ncbi:MAG: hypothetical protein WBB48_00605 [Thermodesulfobacteriota bacterium]